MAFDKEKYAQSMLSVLNEIKKGWSAILSPKVVRIEDDITFLDIEGTTCSTNNVITLTHYEDGDPVQTTEVYKTSLDFNISNAILHLAKDNTRRCALFAAPLKDCLNEDGSFKKIAHILVGYTNEISSQGDINLSYAWNNTVPFPLAAYVVPSNLVQTDSKWVILAYLQQTEHYAVACGDNLTLDELYNITYSVYQ